VGMEITVAISTSTVAVDEGKVNGGNRLTDRAPRLSYQHMYEVEGIPSSGTGWNEICIAPLCHPQGVIDSGLAHGGGWIL